MTSTYNDKYHAMHRATKACDRCRVKKVKCDGRTPCARCEKDNQACMIGNRGKNKDRTVSAIRVDELQAQNDTLTRALRTIWTEYVAQDGTGNDLSIHEMCSRVGALDSSHRPFPRAADGMSGSPSETGQTYSTEDNSPTMDHHPDASFFDTGEMLTSWTDWNDMDALHTSIERTPSRGFPGPSTNMALQPQPNHATMNGHGHMSYGQVGLNTFQYSFAPSQLHSLQQPHHFSETHHQQSGLAKAVATAQSQLAPGAVA